MTPPQPADAEHRCGGERDQAQPAREHRALAVTAGQIAGEDLHRRSDQDHRRGDPEAVEALVPSAQKTIQRTSPPVMVMTNPMRRES